MTRLSKAQQKFLWMFVAGAIGTLIGYFVNQLPGIPDDLKQKYPFWDKAVIGTVALLTVTGFAVAWQLLRLNGDEGLKEPAAKQLEKSRLKLLERLRKTWIEGVLERSLYHYARLELGLKVSSDTIHPWEIRAVKGQEQVTLPLGTPVIQRFDRLGVGGSMVILGEPGSGKTTTLLELARDLLVRAEVDANASLPVVLHLAGWNRGYRPKQKVLWFEVPETPPQSLADWVIGELEQSPLLGELAGKDYRVDSRVGQWWLREEGRLVLLLDGLDEVAENQREACAKAINEFRQDPVFGNVEVVVCCRVNDYRALETKLKLDEALLIQPLTLEQIEDYLVQAKVDLPEIRNLLASEDLHELAKQPLTLWILALAYRSIDRKTFALASSEQRISALIDTYLYEQIVGCERKKLYIRVSHKVYYSVFLVVYWLRVISSLVSKDENFALSSYKPNSSWLYIIDPRINSTHKKLKFILKQVTPVKEKLILILYLGGLVSVVLLIAFTILVTVSSVILVLNISLPIWVVTFFYKAPEIFLYISLSLLLLVCSLTCYLKFFDYCEKTHDYSLATYIGSSTTFNFLLSSIRASWSIYLTISLLIPSIFLALSNFKPILDLLVSKGLITATVEWLIGYFIFFSVIGFPIFLLRVSRYFLLDFLLKISQVVPWNYREFLDWACDRFILQKVGDSYIFIHRMIREHFAEMDIEAFMQWVESHEAQSKHRS